MALWYRRTASIHAVRGPYDHMLAVFHVDDADTDSDDRCWGYIALNQWALDTCEVLSDVCWF